MASLSVVELARSDRSTAARILAGGLLLVLIISWALSRRPLQPWWLITALEAATVFAVAGASPSSTQGLLLLSALLVRRSVVAPRGAAAVALGLPILGLLAAVMLRSAAAPDPYPVLLPTLMSLPWIVFMAVLVRLLTEAVAARVDAEVTARAAESHVRAVFDTTPAGLLQLDATGAPQLWNRAATALLGLGSSPSATAIDQAAEPRQLPPPSTALLLRRLQQSDSLVNQPWAITAADGTTKHLSVSTAQLESGGLLAVLIDVTDRVQLAEELRHRARHDDLTGLPNRFHFVDHLEHALRETRDRGSQVVVQVLNLDHFKKINAGLGHAAGDRLLVQVADRLRASLAATDTVARLGADEFAVLQQAPEPLMPDQGSASRHAAKPVAEAFAEPFDLTGVPAVLTASIGIAAVDATQLDTDAANVLRDASLAMHQAKAAGRDRSEVFSLSLREPATRRLAEENALRQAVERGQLHLHYQPLFDLPHNCVIGAEALLRWQHPERGNTSPDEFIGLAEDTGLIVPIGAWVLREACRQMVQWHTTRALPAQFVVSVNIAPQQLTTGCLLTQVTDVLTETGLAPAQLNLELTERSLLREADTGLLTLEALHQLGVQLSVDDFGTGYSSLSYLKRLPVSVVKIDRSFVQGLPQDPDDTAIITAITAMAHALGLRVLAEGVETEKQLQALRRLGCDGGQGFYLGRPAADLDPRLPICCG